MTDKQVNQFTAKTTPVGNDLILINDSAAANACKKVTLTNFVANFIKTIILTANQLAVYAAGTVYSLTTSAAQIVFGTTSPDLTLTDSVGRVYQIRWRVLLKYNGATFAANRTATIKLRRVNNTPADVTNGSAAVTTGIVTTTTGAFIELSREVFYTTAGTNDDLQLFGSLDVGPTVGSLDVVDAEITATRLF